MSDEPKRGRPTQEGEAQTGHIHIRTTLHRKSAYVRAAKPKPLAEWAKEILDKDANYEKRRVQGIRPGSDSLDATGKEI